MTDASSQDEDSATERVATAMRLGQLTSARTMLMADPAPDEVRSPLWPLLQVTCLLRLGETGAALSIAQGALAASEPGATDHGISMLGMACCHRATGQVQAALAHLDKAQPDLGEGLYGRALTERAGLELEVGRLDQAWRCLREAESQVKGSDRDLPLEHLVCRAQILLAGSEIPAARQAATTALLSARRAGFTWHVGAALTVMGRSLVEERDYAAARKMQLLALKTHKEMAHRAGVAACLGGLGLAMMGSRQVAEGVRHLNRAIRICHDCEHQAAEGAWRLQLDHALVLLDRTEWRIQELQTTVDLFHRLGDGAREAALSCELGNCYREIRDPEAAVPWYRRALRLGSETTSALDQLNLGMALVEAGDLVEGARSLQAGLALASEPTPLRAAASEVLLRLSSEPDQS